MSYIIEEFKTLFLRGRVVDLVIAVILGKTFGDLIISLVNSVIIPVLSIILGKTDFADLEYKYSKDISIEYGKFINVVIIFVLSILSVFFLFIRPFNKMIDENEKKIKLKEAKEEKQLDEKVSKLENEIRVLKREKEILENPWKNKFESKIARKLMEE